jgi:hypothetical protein
MLGAVGAAVLALALTLSACQTPQAGAAATVGDERISVAEVQDAYADIVPLIGQDQGITQGDILNLLILRPYLLQAAAAQGAGVSMDDARQDIKSVGASDGTTLSAAGLRVWQANLANAALQKDQSEATIRATYTRIGEQLKKAGVHINPRYGAGIDYTNFSIKPEVPDWIKSTVQPSPGATPPAQGTPTPAQEPTGTSTPEATGSP